MRRLLRRRVTVPVFSLAAALIAAGYFLSHSELAGRLVERKLEERLGTIVDFDQASVGVTGTTLTNFRIHERNGGPESTPFLTVGRLDLNVGAAGAIFDKSPSRIRMREASVVLRFDRQGELLTRLPNAAGGDSFPTLKIESATLTIRQEGRADSVFRGINMVVASKDRALALAGTVQDEGWGTWTAEGSIPIDPTGAGRLVLRTSESPSVTPDLLRQVPLVNPNAWNYVRLAGTTSAELDLTVDASSKQIGYRVALAPTQTSVDIPNVGLHFTDANGQLVAEKNVVTLTDVRAASADGAIRVQSRLDFSGSDSVLRFHADLNRMDVQKLPQTWRLPKQIDGWLSGNVELVVTLPATGGTRLDVTGRATISEAKLKGRPIRPIELDVVCRPGGGLEFVEREPPVSPAPPSGGSKSPAAVLVTSTPRLPAQLVRGEGPPGQKDFVQLNITLREVEVAELLKTAGMEAPAKIAGKVTVRVQVEIPADAPDEFKRYRLTGTATSPKLSIDEMAINDVSAKLNMRDGKLTVRDLVGRVPALGGSLAGGSFTAEGEVDTAESYAYRATVKLDRVALEQVEKLKSLFPVSASLAGEASASAELTGTLSPFTMRGSGTAEAGRLQVGKVPAKDLSFKWHTDSDTLHLHDAGVAVFGGKVTGQFDIPLRNTTSGAGSAKIEGIDLGEVSKSLLAGTAINIEGKAGGTLKLHVPAGAAGQSRTTAEVELAAPDIKFQGIPAKKIKGTGAYAAGVFKYNLVAAALGGQVEVIGQYPPDNKAPPPKESKPTPGIDLGKLRIKRIQMAGLWDMLGLKQELAPLDGEISGEFPLHFDDDAHLIGTGAVRGERLSWKGREMAGVGRAIIRLTPKSMALDEATLYVGEGMARVNATRDRGDPEQSKAQVILTNIPADRAMFMFPGLGKRFDMAVSGRLHTTFGKEWRGSGVLTASKGRAFGVPVTDVRVPLDWVSTPDRGRTEVRIREATAAAAGGSISARADVNLFNDLPPRFSGDVQFRNANVSQAFREAGRVVGNLQVTGKLEFAADQFRGSDDVGGKLDARLGESQPFSLPVFAAIVPYLGVGRDYSTTIREGEVHAVLGRGVWRVQQVTLSGPSLDLFAEGSMTLDGRLNATVVSRSGERPAQTVLRRFMPASTLTTISPTNLQLSRSALTDAASLLGSYVVYMEVNGTVNSPVVRLQTVRTLSEAAVRFFLFRFITPLQ